MKQYKIWEALSFAWTEIGLEEEEYSEYAAEIKKCYPSWEEVNSIIKRDVCGSFATDSFLIFPCMLWMIMPDWGFNDKYLRKRMKDWYAAYYWKHFINPVRLLGYPVAVLLSSRVRKKLKKAYQKA